MSNTLPRSGWRWVYMTDLGSANAKHVCDACGYVGLRYVHAITHDALPRFENIQKVGSYCADRLTQTVTASNHERSQKSLLNRRSKWLNRKWRLLMRYPEGHYLNTKGCCVRAFKSSDGWRWSITHQKSQLMYFDDHDYLTLEAAKLAAFDAFQKIPSLN